MGISGLGSIQSSSGGSPLVSFNEAQTAAGDLATQLGSGNIDKSTVNQSVQDLRTLSLFITQQPAIFQHLDELDEPNLFLVAHFINAISAPDGSSGLSLFIQTDSTSTQNQQLSVENLITTYQSLSSQAQTDQWTTGLQYFCNALNNFSGIWPTLNMGSGSPDYANLLVSFVQTLGTQTYSSADAVSRMSNDPLFSKVFPEVLEICSNLPNIPEELKQDCQNLSATLSEGVQYNIDIAWTAMQKYFALHY